MRYDHPGVACAALALLFSAGVQASGASTETYPEDCFNDTVSQRDDLEPPLPGSDADLLRITDEDIKTLLADIAAAEQRRQQQSARGTPRRSD